MQYVDLRPLEWEVIDALMVQALLTHPANPLIAFDQGRPRLVLTEFVRLVEAEHEADLNKRLSGPGRRVKAAA